MKRILPSAFLAIASMLLLLMFQPYLQAFATQSAAPPEQNCQSFAQTGKQVCGKFLTYWQNHGGLAQQGYPISDELQEKSATDGKTYTVQYFERAVFELHPDNQPPYDVLLSLLGSSFYKQKYNGQAPGQHASTDNPRVFAETGKTIGGAFRQYWESHGGLAQQGFPISDEFQEMSQTDGKTYTVQYFQRAVFEYHLEFAGTANQVQLSLLGTFFYKSKYGGAQPTSPPAPTATPGPVGATSQVLFYTGGTNALPALVDEQGSIFPQKEFQLTDVPYTHLIARGQGKVMLYNSYRGDIRTGTLNADGRLNMSLKPDIGVGFDQVAAVDDYTVVFFNTSTTRLLIVREGVNGNFVTTQDSILMPNSTSYYSRARMASPGMGLLLFYLPGTPQAIVVTAKIDGNGKYVGLQTSTTTAGWDYIVGTHNNYLLFYSTATGGASFGSIGSDGSFAAHTSFVLGPGWTNIVDLSNNILLLYESHSGTAATRKIDYYTGQSDLKTYKDDDALSTVWSYLIAAR